MNNLPNVKKLPPDLSGSFIITAFCFFFADPDTEKTVLKLKKKSVTKSYLEHLSEIFNKFTWKFGFIRIQ